MRRVRRKDTAPELTLRSALHRRGWRFRKHLAGLPGTPDVAFPKRKVAVFVDGDFWHGRDFETWSGKLQPFWREKIERNIARDARQRAELEAAGWHVIRVWEKDVKKRLDDVLEQIEAALGGSRVTCDRARPSGGTHSEPRLDGPRKRSRRRTAVEGPAHPHAPRVDSVDE